MEDGECKSSRQQRGTDRDRRAVPRSTNRDQDKPGGCGEEHAEQQPDEQPGLDE
jgi:hypothetical protein